MAAWARPAILGVMAAVVGASLLAACGAGQVVHLPTSGSAPPPIVRALASADGRHIIVPADESGCGMPSLSAVEDARSVTLSLRTVPATGVCVDLARRGQLAVTLRAPLFGRSLRDAVTGRTVPYFDGRTLLTVGHLPAGYRFAGDEVDVLPPTSVLDSGGTTCWTRAYVGPDGYPNAQVTQSQSATPRLTDMPRLGTLVVTGHPATLREASGYQAITWTAAGTGITVATAPGRTTVRHALPASELAAISTGLHS